MPEISQSSARYREQLGNIDATAHTMNAVAATRVPWGLVVLVVVLVVIAAVVVYLCKDTLQGWWQRLWKPVADLREQADAEQRTGQNLTIDEVEAARLADQFYDCFGLLRDQEDTLVELVRSIPNAANWDYVVSKFGNRACKTALLSFHSTENLPTMISRHINASRKVLIRAHLLDIGVKNPGI